MANDAHWGEQVVLKGIALAAPHPRGHPVLLHAPLNPAVRERRFVAVEAYWFLSVTLEKGGPDVAKSGGGV